MTNVLNLLRDVRPRVESPAESGQRAALERLLEAIEDEPPGLFARRGRREEAVPSPAHPPRGGFISIRRRRKPTT